MSMSICPKFETCRRDKDGEENFPEQCDVMHHVIAKRITLSGKKQLKMFPTTSKCCHSKAKPQVSLTAPNRYHFAQVSLTVLDIFLEAIAKAKKLICKSIAQNLKQVSLTKRFFSFGNGV